MSLSPLASAHRLTLIDPNATRRVLVGPRNRFADPETAECIPWTGAPAEPEQVVHAHLEPTAAQARKGRLPVWVAEAASLRSLTIPLGLVRDAAANGVLDRLEVLTVCLDSAVLAEGSAESLAWPAGCWPRLKALVGLQTGPRAKPIWPLVGLGAAAFPGVELLQLDLDTGGAPLAAFSDAPRLVHVALTRVGGFHPAPLLPANLRYLWLNTVDRRVSLAGLDRLSHLESLAVLNSRAPLDCAALPPVRELLLWGSKKLAHTETLVDQPRLEHLEVVDCGRPFDQSAKARLAARGLATLDVAHA